MRNRLRSIGVDERKGELFGELFRVGQQELVRAMVHDVVAGAVLQSDIQFIGIIAAVFVVNTLFDDFQMVELFQRNARTVSRKALWVEHAVHHVEERELAIGHDKDKNQQKNGTPNDAE